MDSNSHNVVPSTSAQVATPIVAQTLVMPTIMPISVSPGEKLEKFNGLNFKRWQQKMFFYVTTLNLARFLTKDAPKLKEDEHDICAAQKSEGPLITHQPAESLWISCNTIPHHCVPFIGIHNLTKIGQSLLCTGSSIQNPTCTTIQSHDPYRAQYNAMIALGPFKSKN